MHKLLFAIQLCIAAHLCYAGQEYDGSKYDGYEPVEIDPEPNWSTAAYSCPLSIKTGKGEYKFSWYRITHAGDPLAELRGAPRKYIPFRFQEGEEIDLVCGYKGFDTGIILRLRGLTACGRMEKPAPLAVCWTTDPYTKKQKN